MSGTVPLVTVLMPCRGPNRRLLRAAVGSVFSQSSPRWHLSIIVDDGCPRGADAVLIREVLREAGGQDDARVFLAGNESCPLTGAINTGMRRALTPYVCTLHCDDLLDRKAVEVLTRYIEANAEVDYFHSSRVIVDEEDRPLSGILKARASFTPRDFHSGVPVKHLHCWKAAPALSIGGMDETMQLNGADDYDFPWCMAEAGFSFLAIPECLYRYRDHREHYRLTTHVPLDLQIGQLRAIWIKHGLGEGEIASEIARRKAGYLKQALFADERDRMDRERKGFDPREGWREPYR